MSAFPSAAVTGHVQHMHVCVYRMYLSPSIVNCLMSTTEREEERERRVEGGRDEEMEEEKERE